MRAARLLLTGLAAVALLAGCGGNEESVVTTSIADVPAVSGEVDEPDEPEVPEAPDARPPVIDGLDEIVTLTAMSGGGERPLLAWEPVTGATKYLVVVFDADGRSTWSMLTSESSIHVGGAAQIPTANSGPRITPGSSWVVYADDADGRAIAASGRIPIDP